MTPKELAAAIRARLEALQRDTAEAAAMLARLESTPGELAGSAAELERASQENLELANRLSEAEQMNAAMMNMYISSHSLHATLDPVRVVETIREIVINFVGGERFAVLLRHEESGDFDVVSGEDHQERYPNARVEAQGVLGAVVASGEPFVHMEEGAPREGILAAVPLAVDGGRVVGAVVLFRLLQQKARLTPADVELLHLLSTHAATALINARLYARTERKLRTLETLVAMVKDGGSSRSAPPAP
jgi:hypothetical protein